MAPAANYTARRMAVDGFEVLRLTDDARQTVVSIAPEFGNNAYEMKVNGKDVLWSPQPLGQLVASHTYAGNPIMAPWANRLDQDAFYANGKKYALNAKIGNILRDNRGLPMHGLLAHGPAWKLISLEADGVSARATCRLEFGQHPDLMAQFPFAHTIDLTHRLRNGTLEVETLLQNYSPEPMPVSLGYHPFFQVHDAPRDAWKIHAPAREHMPLTGAFLPTGERLPLALANPAPLASLGSLYLFSSLVRRPDGCAEFWVEGRKERVTLVQGPKYGTAVYYAELGTDYVCFEPMTAPINGLNLAQARRWGSLQYVPPGGTWQESFWVEATGF